MTRRHLSLILVFVMWVAAPAALAQKSAKPAAKPSTPSFGNVDGISAKQLREYLTFIASDELEGRDTPSRGLDIAAMLSLIHI